MSRIHEAMRKAADEAGESPAGPPASPVGAGDAATLSRETFPIELGGRRPKAATPSAHAPAPGIALAPALASAAPVAAGFPERRSSASNENPIAFERIDARYAGKVVVDEEISAA